MKKHLKKKWMLPMGVLVMLLSSNHVGDCPPVDGEFSVLLPHEFDNTKFFRCVGGEPIECECLPGTIFYPEFGVCDWPGLW